MPDFDDTYVDSFDQLVGNTASIAYLKRYAADIEQGARRRPVLIHGPTGTGKTLAAHLLAKWLGWNLIEMSASDYRDSSAVERRLRVSSSTRSLFGSRNMLLLDEIDELSGKYDSGAQAAVSRLISESRSPVMLTANDMWDQSITFLRGRVDTVEFKRLSPPEISKVLANVAKKLGEKPDQNAIDAISNRSSGDARSAINDFIVMIGSDESMLDSIGMRDRKTDIFSVLDKIFCSNTYSAPLRAAAQSDVDAEMLLKWIDENMPHRYTSIGDISAGLSSLAEATTYHSRASRKQYYTYWRYMNVLMSSGVALAKSGMADRSRRYSFPKVISTLSGTKSGRAVEVAIAKKLQGTVHHGVKAIRFGVLPLLYGMVDAALSGGESEESVSDFLESRFGLADKEAAYIIANRSSRQAR